MDHDVPQVAYFSGLDLGQAGTFTALAVLQRSLGQHPQNEQRLAWQYAVRHLGRYPLGTAYHAILTDVVEKFGAPPLWQTRLVLVQTGVGQPVVEAFQRAALPAIVQPVILTAGHTRGFQDGHERIPKRELASVLQLVLQERRLKIAEQLHHAGTLREELVAFRPTIRLGADDAPEHWREREHDDLVLAVALAVWMAEREPATWDVGEPLVLEPARPRWW
jgi:hypothetical protein